MTEQRIKTMVATILGLALVLTGLGLTGYRSLDCFSRLNWSKSYDNGLRRHTGRPTKRQALARGRYLTCGSIGYGQTLAFGLGMWSQLDLWKNPATSF